jgi:N4-gp56 family major capsid protein
MQYAGSGSNSIFQRITELTKDERGERAVISLVTDLQTDGIMGDYDLEGNEEALQAYDEVITIDQIRHANRTKGKMAMQKSVINFRDQSKDKLAFWLADRIDQMAFLTLSGIGYQYNTNGSARPVNATGSNLSDLAFAADVAAPTSARHLMWDTSAKSFVAGDTTAVTAEDKVSYEMLVNARAVAKERFIPASFTKGNEEFYHVFLHPMQMKALKLDPDYLANIRSGANRGESNPLFTGGIVTQDGLVIHEFRHVYNTTGAAAGAKWGAAGDVNGARALLVGAQALALADLGTPSWEEKTFDYGNQHGISVGKILGFKKPQFHNIQTGDVQDHAVLALDTAI